MLALYVDFNAAEVSADGGEAVYISFRNTNPPVLEKSLEAGSRVIIYCEDIRCEGILRPGTYSDGWVAEIVPETIVDLEPDEFDRLLAETERARQEND